MTPAENDMDLRARTVALERQFVDLHTRTTELEKWQRKSEVDDARMDVRFLEMDKKLSTINANLSRLMWMVISGLVAGIIFFIINGGLAKTQETAAAIIAPQFFHATRPLVCPTERPVLVRSYCRAPTQKPWFSEAAAIAK